MGYEMIRDKRWNIRGPKDLFGGVICRGKPEVERNLWDYV